MDILNRRFKLTLQPERIRPEAALLSDALNSPGLPAGRSIREPQATDTCEQAIYELFGMVYYWSPGWL